MDALMKMLKDLVPILGQAGVDALANELKILTGSMDEAWKKTVMNLIADAVEKNGVQGIRLALNYIDKLMNGKKLPKIDWANLRTASDIVAQLQNAEADHKKAVNDFLAKASKVLGQILSAVIKGLLA